jgi:hypothetical protein
MGYCMGTSACYGCKRIFSYNPMRVPSIRDPDTGSKEPVCAACIARANVQRAKIGMPPHVVYPDAYEPCDERELG